MKLAFLLLCNAFVTMAGNVLPWYMKRCSLSDPNINQCIIRSGNLAISQLIKGDCFLNAPISTPLYIPEINLPGGDFTATLRSVYLKGLETFKMTSVTFNLAVPRQLIILEAPTLEISADYVIYGNKKLVRSVQGGGKLEALLHRIVVNYSDELSSRNVSGVTYLNFESPKIKLTSNRIYHEFSGIYSNDYGNINWLLKKQQQIINEKLIPAIEKVLRNYISNITTNITKKLPLFEIFLP